MSARTLVLGTLAVAILTTTSATAGPWLPAPGEHYNELSGSFGRSEVVFDQDGEKRYRPFGEILEQQDVVSYNEFGWKNWGSIAFNIPFVSRTSSFPDFGLHRTQTAIADVSFGFRAKIKEGPTAASAEVFWIGPAGYDRDAFPALGPGQQNVGGQVAFGAPIASSGFFQLEGGYMYRFEAPPDQVFGSGAVAWWFGQSLLVSGRFEGFQTVGADSIPDEGRALNVGPEVRFRLDDNMDVFAGSWHVATGKNVAHFNRYYVGLALKQTRLNRLQGYLGGKRRP
jgi:hypothetical protein